ncbi:hypothetical protein L3Q82_023533, partial [Scortum barcoo]
MSASLPDELNTFYAHFESTSPAVEVQKAQEDHCPPVISRADVCRTLKRINTRKAPGPDGIPRPSSQALTSTIMKCFERLVKLFITSSIPDSLDPLQFAYRPNRSTEDAIALTLHTALSHLDQRDTYTPGCVDGQHHTSSTLTLNTGAPQGCVLSPLLYSLFTHDCVATNSSNTIIKLADDTTVIGHWPDHRRRDEETAYREEVRALKSWCQDNNLQLNNVSKTKELIVDFRRRRQREEHAPLSINGTTCGESQQLQVPPVHISEDLTWTHHTDFIYHKVSQTAALLPPLQAAERLNMDSKDPLQLLQVTHREDPDWLHHRL